MLNRNLSKSHASQLTKAVQLFNQHKWYECHEVLEDLWRTEADPVRDVYKGILQIAVARYHLERSNRTGALRLFRRGLTHIRPFLPHCFGLDLLALAKQTTNIIGLLQTSSAPAPLHIIPKLQWSTHSTACTSTPPSTRHT